jgi:signal transduction histidine kinase
MKRPWQVWLAFAVSAATAAAALGWLTRHALRVDRDRAAARAAAELEQRASLVLWRMDTKLAPFIAEEIARPHQFYESFVNLPNEGAKGGPAGEAIASPLLAGAPRNVLLNFDASIDGSWRSPQAPPPALDQLAGANGVAPQQLLDNRAKLAVLANAIDVSGLIAQLPAERAAVSMGGGEERAGLAASDAAAGVQSPFYSNYAALNAPAQERSPNAQRGAQQAEASEQLAAPDASGQQLASAPTMQQQAAVEDLTERTARYQQAAEQEFAKQRVANQLLAPAAIGPSPTTIEGVSRPIWVGDRLLLARRVELGGRTHVQGSWLDWPGLKADLLIEAADLLPEADLAPVVGDAAGSPTRMLAGLPVELVLGDSATALAGGAAVDQSLQWALGFGWLALALALLAVGLLLWGVLALSERRAAFVSSVTHELRTPLTTFRMYAEMLARDMAPSPERRREYLETLKAEADRLTHLVENVLSYARLERGRRPQRSERTTPSALLERLEPRLAERAARAGMELMTTIEPSVESASLTTDVGVVEQILFNLVDNAAKYAARASDRRILLHAAREGEGIAFRVTDHGPGFASLRAAERSAPFSKSAQEAAETAPGVGLGLALCRRLAKQLGGRLEISPPRGVTSGASVTLRLPLG